MPRQNAPWVGPTLRLIPWWGLALPVGAAALAGLLVRARGGGVPDQLGIAAAAAIAAGAPQVLEDQAHRLLSAVPLGRRRRVGHRLILFLPALMVAWLLVSPLVNDAQGPNAVSLAPVVALAAIGLAGGCLAGRRRHEVAAPIGTAIPLGIVATRLMLTDRTSHADILDVWIDHPWGTAAVAGIIGVASVCPSGSSNPEAP
jgi:hypothetical protein